jgi:hypothetical protein
MHTVFAVDFTVIFNDDLINAETSVGFMVLLNNSETPTVIYRLFHPSKVSLKYRVIEKEHRDYKILSLKNC